MRGGGPATETAAASAAATRSTPSRPRIMRDGSRPGDLGYGDGSSNTTSAPPSGLAATICSPIFPKNGGAAHRPPPTPPNDRLASGGDAVRPPPPAAPRTHL